MSKEVLTLEHMARVEGHGQVKVSIKEGVVESVQMQIDEPARFFESMVRGRRFDEIPYIASRICGICSANHVITSLLAIEQAFGVKVSERTRMLRELLVYGSYLQNHATHLYVLAAPDYLKQQSIFPLADANKELFDKALALKSLGNELCCLVGGRSIHPITAVVGGFTSEPTAQQYLDMAQQLDKALEFALTTVDVFNGFPVPSLATDGEMMAMVQEGAYPISLSREFEFVKSGARFDCTQLHDAMEEYAVPHSCALFARARETKKPYMVGALARINASWNNLTQQARFAAAKAGLRPPERNPFNNNVAQAVELVDAVERCAALCRALAADKFEGTTTPVAFTPRAGKGIGFTEAPRGTVFHDLEFDEQGYVAHAAIVTPTAQNVANLEADMMKLACDLAAQGVGEDELKRSVEMLVRAYDPCFSCSVH